MPKVETNAPAATNGAIVEPRYRWPPFPSAPAGKTIVPLKSFKAKGIPQPVDDSDDEELDAYGVKTVKLPVVHIADPVEKAARDRAKRAKKRRKGLQGPGLGGRAQGGISVGEMDLNVSLASWSKGAFGRRVDF